MLECTHLTSVLLQKLMMYLLRWTMNASLNRSSVRCKKKKKIVDNLRTVMKNLWFHFLTHIFSIFFHFRFWMKNLFLWKCMHLGKCCACTPRLCTSNCLCNPMTWKRETRLSTGLVDSSEWMKISSNPSKSFSLPLFKRNICPTSIFKTKTHFSILQLEAEL